MVHNGWKTVCLRLFFLILFLLCNTYDPYMSLNKCFTSSCSTKWEKKDFCAGITIYNQYGASVSIILGLQLWILNILSRMYAYTSAVLYCQDLALTFVKLSRTLNLILYSKWLWIPTSIVHYIEITIRLCEL